MLKRTIEHVQRSELKNIQVELIVVDDNSDDATKSLELPQVKVIHNASQQMMTKSRNIGARAAQGDFVLFIDDDNVVDSQMIKKLYSFGLSHQDFGMVGPSMYLLHNEKKYLDWQAISLYTSKTTAHISDSTQEYFLSDGIPNVFMIRKDAFEKYGYFDEEIIQSFTEPEFAFRLRAHGLKCAVVNGAITYHDVVLETEFSPRNMGGMFKQKAYCLIRNRSILVFRYGNIFQKIIYLVLFSWIWPSVYSFFMLKYKRFDLIKLYWRGYIDGLFFVFTGKIRSTL